MTSLLEESIVDATSLKEAAIKNAQTLILEKYASEIKEAVDSILEADDLNQDQNTEEDPLSSLGGGDASLGALGGMPGTEDPLAKNIPMAATDGEKLCPCPDEDQEIEINFDQLAQQMDGGDDQSQALPGQMGELAPEEDASMMAEAEDGIQVPASLGPELHMYHMNMGDPIYKVGSLAAAGKPVPPSLLDSAISNLENLKGKMQDPQDQAELDSLLSQLQSLAPPEKTSEPESNLEQPNLEQSLYEDVELTEEEVNQMLEVLKVEMNVVPHGHIGHATTSERENANNIQLASMQDTKVAEELKDLKKSLEKIQESNVKLIKENKSFKIEYNKIKSIALRVSNKLKEINLENAKLMYENSALKSVSLNERQKQTIVEAISKVGSVEEAKIIFESLSKNSNVQGVKMPETLTEALALGKGNLLKISNQTKTNESVNPNKERMQKLAGIK